MIAHVARGRPGFFLLLPENNLTSDNSSIEKAQMRERERHRRKGAPSRPKAEVNLQHRKHEKTGPIYWVDPIPCNSGSKKIVIIF